MFILNEGKLEELKKMILERTIYNIKIEKVGQRYYCECETAKNNPSSKLMELHEMLCEIDLSDKSVTKFYLYYDQVLDDIIINKTIDDSVVTSKVENDNPKSGTAKIPEIDEVEELNYCLRRLVSYFDDNQITKIGVTIGKKKYNVPVISMLSNMHYVIENTEKTKNS